MLTLSLNRARSSNVKESDLAMTGTTLTTSDRRFKTAMSIWSQEMQRLIDASTHRLQCVARRVDEEKTAVDAGVRDVLVAHSSQLLAEEGRVLVFDLESVWALSQQQATHVFDDRLPAAVIVNVVAIAWSIDDVQAKLDTVLHDDWGEYGTNEAKQTHHGTVGGSQ